MIKFCPRCNQRYMVEDNTSDYSHICNSKNVVLDQEDVVVVGNWEDQDKGAFVSGTRGPQASITAGAENKLQGRRPQIEEGKVQHDLTRRAVPAQDKRQRQHEEFINLDGKGLG